MYVRTDRIGGCQCRTDVYRTQNHRVGTTEDCIRHACTLPWCTALCYWLCARPNPPSRPLTSSFHTIQQFTNFSYADTRIDMGYTTVSMKWAILKI